MRLLLRNLLDWISQVCVAGSQHEVQWSIQNLQQKSHTPQISILALGCFGSAVTSWWCESSQNVWKRYLWGKGVLSSSERFLVVICVIISAKRRVNNSLKLIWFWCWISYDSATSWHYLDSISLSCRTQATVVSWYLHRRKLKHTAIYFFAWEEFQRKSNIPKLNFARIFF